MPTSMLIEIVAIFALILCNFWLAMSEMAVVSARKTKLLQMSKNGNTRALIALKLAENPSVFLSTVQIGVTLVGILAGAVAGATIAEELAAKIEEWLHIAYAESIAVAITVAIVTYMSVILGELIPKRIALGQAEKLACTVAPLLLTMSRISAPVVGLLSNSTDYVLSLFGIGKELGGPSVSDEEINVLLTEGAQAGIFEPEEQRIVKEVLKLGDRRVAELMTPRNDVVWLDTRDSFETNVDKALTSVHGTFPVADGDLDKTIGFVKSKDLFAAALKGTKNELSQLTEREIFIPDNKTALSTLELFRTERKRMALVADEYGSVRGVITMGDMLRALVGEIPEEGEEAHIKEVAAGEWLVSGELSVDELKELLKLAHLPDEREDVYHTAAGFVVHLLGHVPTESESVCFEDFEIHITKMQRYRIQQVRIVERHKS